MINDLIWIVSLIIGAFFVVLAIFIPLVKNPIPTDFQVGLFSGILFSGLSCIFFAIVLWLLLHVRVI